MSARAISPPIDNNNNNDPRVPVLRSQLLKAQKEVLQWSEKSAQWKASAERRSIREAEHIKRCKTLEAQLEETKKELESTRKRHREEVEMLDTKYKRVVEAVKKTLEDEFLGQT